ncbi:MAG: DNA repair protein RecO [Parachlamydiaceae bacterium]|nr:MAG: DNA repair protein RecO [Parachlamydiaceae bacterium]
MKFYRKSAISLNRFLVFMQILQTEGVILKVLDFRDYDQIITVFTSERGIVKWIYKRKSSSQSKLSPLVRAEFTYSESRGEIWKCREINILNQYLKLRENFSWLETAGRLIQSILLSQVEQKPAPNLYRLFLTYLEKIPLSTNLAALEISFIILLLKHEGLVNFDLHCTICQRPLQSLYIYQGNHFCPHHAPVRSLEFNHEETLAWMQIAAAKTFSELQSIFVPQNLREKAENLFKIFIKQ